MADRAHRRLTLTLLVLAAGCIHPAGSPAYRSAVERGYTVSYDSTRHETTVEGLGVQASRRLLVTALFETAGDSLQRPDTVYLEFAAEAGDWGFLHSRDVTLLLDDSVHLALGAARPKGTRLAVALPVETFRTIAESRSVSGRLGEAGFVLTPEHFRILRAVLARALGTPAGSP
jgi:hypothetical protein